MPENTVSVTRPGKWGNRFKLGDYVKIGGGTGIDMWACLITTKEYATPYYTHLDTVEKVISAYKLYMERYPARDLHELKGRNLACFCPLNKPCHADVLLELANK
jgi:hypothetical protein